MSDDSPNRRGYQSRRRTLPVVMLLSAAAVGWIVFETKCPAWPIKLPAYHGMTRSRVLEELGEPYYRYDLTVEQIDDEFHIELHNYLDPQIAYQADETIFVEWRWRDGEYYIAMWFRDVEGKWIVVDSVRWHESTKF
jgi:hypothetical protein